MSEQRWQTVKEVFAQALKQPRERRPEFLSEVCRDHPSLREEVESLLEAHEEPQSLLDNGGFDVASIIEAESRGYEGKEFGRYKVLREIGRGGMGTVYLAARADEEFQKQVAIKVIKRGLDTDEVRRRFRNERQILARLEHPNIARLLDGGTTPDGLSYFVMEYVEGQPLNEYADTRKLSTTERLNLFRTICAAVQHAHQNLIIHRDLKSGNILVTKDGTPKLLDFGIAKLLHGEGEPEAETLTATGLRILTPEYASPEQARGLPVTTATDVYSLGVILYELLTGKRPYRLKSRNSDEIAHIICEEQPERPSTAISRIDELTGAKGETSTEQNGRSIIETRGERTIEQLRRTLKGDLDNIILMALRKEPKRRYESAAEFSADIKRHLDGLPVIAQKDTVKYRAKKFVRRNRVGMAAAALILLALVAGIIATAWQAGRATREARIAAQERDRARVEAAKAERISGYLQNVLGYSDTGWVTSNPDRKRDATLADALDEASQRAESELADQPEVLAAVHLTIGRAYAGQLRLDNAESHLRAALDIRRRLYGTEHQETAQIITHLGGLAEGRGNYEEAESLLSEAVTIYRRARDAGNVNKKWFAAALLELGLVQGYKGDSAAGEATLREALEVSADLTGPDRGGLPVLYNNLAIMRRGQGDLDGAIAYQEKALEEYRRLPGRLSVNRGSATANLAFYVMMKGDYARSEALFQEALSIYKDTIGEQHLSVSYARINLADNYYAQGNYRRAREEIDQAIEIQRKLLPEGHVDYGLSYTVLGKVLTRTNDLKGGESYLRRALEARTRGLKAGHRWTAETQSALGENLTAQKRYDAAESLLTESHDTLKASLGQQDPRTVEARRRLVALYEAWKKPEMVARFNQP